MRKHRVVFEVPTPSDSIGRLYVDNGKRRLDLDNPADQEFIKPAVAYAYIALCEVLGADIRIELERLIPAETTPSFRHRRSFH